MRHDGPLRAAMGKQGGPMSRCADRAQVDGVACAMNNDGLEARVSIRDIMRANA